MASQKDMNMVTGQVNDLKNQCEVVPLFFDNQEQKIWAAGKIVTCLSLPSHAWSDVNQIVRPERNCRPPSFWVIVVRHWWQSVVFFTKRVLVITLSWEFGIPISNNLLQGGDAVEVKGNELWILDSHIIYTFRVVHWRDDVVTPEIPHET